MKELISWLQNLLPGWILFVSIPISLTQDTLGVPEFSVQRGFYESPFSVVITSQGNGASIVYTLDGSDPRTSQFSFSKSSPASVFIDPAIETGRYTAPAVVVRAVATEDGSEPSKVGTHTYFFLNKLQELSPHEQKPGIGWPERNMENSSNQFMDYGLDPEILNDPRYRDVILDAFLSIPAISLVTDLENLFDPQSGIYMNALKHGIAWERPVSVELIHPDDSPGFHINAGLRIRGGWGRRNVNPKHAFRLFFRKDYGSAKLDYPLFGDDGIDEFDKVDLRTSQNYSWAAEGSDRNTLVREVLSRDIQRDMGQPYTRSRYYHLYINGIYWGIYQTQERSEASFASAYFGDSRDDYDVIKVDIGEHLNLYEIEATDGNLDAYHRLWEMASNGFTTDAAYYRVEGKNPDGTPNSSYEVLVDVDNLIDYMLCTYYVADPDGPLNNHQKPNNFYATFNRNNPQGFKFFRHDAEHSLFDRNANLTGPVTGGTEFRHFNPRWLHQRLAVHPEYRLRYADRVYKHFFNQGACTDDASIQRLGDRTSQIDLAIIAQSARWGDSRSTSPRTKDDDWIPAIDFMANNIFPGRTDIVISQFKNRNWYPLFDPPEFNLESGVISPQTVLTITPTSSVGEMYFTLDGNDPRLPESVSAGGQISASALKYTCPMEINETTVVKARTLYNGKWSALQEINLYIPHGYDNLIISEIHYHPQDFGNVNDTELEFIELKNIGNTPLSLDGFSFSRGITYTFPEDVHLSSGSYIVLASNPEEFGKRYEFLPFDEYAGQLANDGETISLNNNMGDTLISVEYDDNFPWPNSTDGDGYSLVFIEENIHMGLNNAENWRASKIENGSPGTNDFITAVEHPVIFSADIHLYQNYPNPLHSITNICFDLFQSNQVRLRVFNSKGQQVVELIDEFLQEGNYCKLFNREGLPPGIYYYQISSKNSVSIKKMALIN
jgi:hypothetical protein